MALAAYEYTNYYVQAPGDRSPSVHPIHPGRDTPSQSPRKPATSHPLGRPTAPFLVWPGTARYCGTSTLAAWHGTSSTHRRTNEARDVRQAGTSVVRSTKHAPTVLVSLCQPVLRGDGWTARTGGGLVSDAANASALHPHTLRLSLSPPSPLHHTPLHSDSLETHALPTPSIHLPSRPQGAKLQ